MSFPFLPLSRAHRHPLSWAGMIALFALGITTWGCMSDDLDLDAKHFECSTHTQCHSGWACVAGICTRESQSVDLVQDHETDGPDLAEADSSDILDALDQEAQDQSIDTDTCCSETSCAQEGMLCNTETCRCEATLLCSQDQQPCNPTSTQASGWRCIEGANSLGTCYRSCSVAESNCPEGTLCMPLGGQSVCLSGDCESFYSDDCDDEDKCVPWGNGAHFCVNSGDATEGGECSNHTECDVGLLCIDSQCQRPDCLVGAEESACDLGQLCESIWADDPSVGLCTPGCAAFVEGFCPEGQWCSPRERETTLNAIVGECVESSGGDHAAFESCSSHEDCQDGLACVPVSEEANMICLPFCDPMENMGLGACPESSECHPLDEMGFDYGLCVPSE